MSKYLRKSLLGLTLFPLFFFSCFKNDLDDFKALKGYKPPQEIAISLFTGTLRIQDSIPFLEALNLADTASVGALMGDFDPFTKVEHVEFKVLIRNSFPVQGSVQFYFLDNQGAFIDSLFTIEKHTVSAGTPSEYTESTVYLYMDNAKFQRIRDASDIKVVYFVDTPGNLDLPYYELNVEVGMKAKRKQ